jgi:hypothetical protein
MQYFLDHFFHFLDQLKQLLGGKENKGNGYLDQLTRRHTQGSYSSFIEMLDAKGGHYPSLHLARGAEKRNAEIKLLIKNYDEAQAARGDSRRAHVTGSKEKPLKFVGK